MPRPARAMPSYQKHGRWYAELRRYRDAGGERVALTVRVVCCPEEKRSP